ncbi:MAG: hypothetical protein AAB372_04195 [Patescibacteria group bacterium]
MSATVSGNINILAMLSGVSEFLATILLFSLIWYYLGKSRYNINKLHPVVQFSLTILTYFAFLFLLIFILDFVDQRIVEIPYL